MTAEVQHRTLRYEVVAELRRLILSGEIEAGSKLREEEAAARLGVSRQPIREAFRHLESEGLLKFSPRRGVVVTPPTSEDIRILHEIRVALELLAVELSADRQDETSMSALRQALDVGHEAAASHDDAVLSDLNTQFHELLSAGCGSAFLADTLRSVRARLHHLVGGFHTAPEISWNEHSTIMQAVLDGDGDEAKTLMRAHLEARHEVSVAADS